MPNRAGSPRSTRSEEGIMTTHDERSDAHGDDVERLLRLAGPRELPVAVQRDAARAAVRSAWREGVRARTRRRWMWIGVPSLAAAAAAVLVALIWRPAAQPVGPPAVLARVQTFSGPIRVVRDGAPRVVARGDAVHPGDRVDTPPGSVAAYALEGGGEIRQNAGTSLQWVAHRRVALDDGHIYVDSGRSSESVAIDTPAGVVRDVGTRFDVRARSGELRVRVREGAVRLESSAETRDASAGQELVAARDGRIAVDATATAGGDWDWILLASSFSLDRATLDGFLTWIETESGRQVILRPASLRREVGATVLNGSVAGLSLSEALDAVLPAVGLTYRYEGNAIVIQRERDGSGR
jgi:ferric-dicitrate binding protein FerR (iron transport regulator)